MPIIEDLQLPEKCNDYENIDMRTQSIHSVFLT